MKKNILFLAFIMSLSTAVLAQEKVVYQTKEGAAINGYDPVSYFTENKAVKGDAKFTYAYQDATWYFSSKEHLKTFKSNPEKYAPQYGGYCAYGYAQGHAAPTTPSAFTVIDGRLYLNYNAQVQQMWVKDTPGFIKKADENYKAEQMKLNNKSSN